MHLHTILTTDANALLKPIHDRMPVILPPKARARWLDLDLTDPQAVQSLLKPLDGKEMEAYPVSPKVNSPRNDSPENIQPV